MSNNIYNANFWELLSKYQIEIPIIQRDYVQGREENKKIRRKIISKFKDASEGNPTKLDFIYGNIKNNTFYPLDGQQRLTSLFLYYLYFALRDKELDNDEVKQLFERFTYSTRISSKEFFNKLVKTNVEINPSTKLSEVIANQNWFITFWKNDPTVTAALGMLDEIHEQCFDSQIDFKTLIKSDNKDITFEFLELEKFGLSDDLYIKMNARGKALTPYENFKADLIGHIKKMRWEITTTYQERFSTKLDGIWTDYFWDGGNNSKTFDTFFINFFHQFLITEVATRTELSSQIIEQYFQDNTDELLLKTISTDELLTKLIANRDDISERYLDYNAYKSIYVLLDNYANSSKKFNVVFNLWISDYTNIDELLNHGRLTYPNRVFHYAHSCFLLKNSKGSNEQYNKWMRVVRNIVANSSIDTVDTFRGALQLIKEISEGCEDIHAFLSQNLIKSRFADRQVKEEIEKSVLIFKDLISYEDLCKIEDTRLCSGRIEFVLNYIKNNTNSDYSKISIITEIFTKYFNAADFSNDIRALFLTCGDGKFYDYWTSWVYVVDLPKRCLIEHTQDLRNYSYKSYFKNYFYDVVSKLIENKDVSYHLSQYKESEAFTKMPIWKQKIITNHSILDNHCKSKMIAIADDNSKCYLMNVGKPRSKESMKQIS